jgi:signal transduction histidine kinase
MISVQDWGSGIRLQELDKVFDRFYQANSELGQKRSGAGLGLAICKRLVEAHGGRIWAESEPGQGSTFHSSCHCRLKRRSDHGQP